MKTIDYLCGQNWIDQYKDAASHVCECIESTCITTTWSSSKGPFGRLYIWRRTPQGESAWGLRCYHWNLDKRDDSYNLIF